MPIVTMCVTEVTIVMMVYCRVICLLHDYIFTGHFIRWYRPFNLRLYPDDQFFHDTATFYDSNGKVSKSHMKSYLYSGHDISEYQLFTAALHAV